MAQSRCTICGMPDAKQCGACRSTAYCSKPCQETDWPTHKILCKPWSKFSPASRPSPNHRLGIYAGVSRKQLNLVWIELDPYKVAGKYAYPMIDHLLMVPIETQKNGRTLRQIRGNSICGRDKNDHVIEMWMQGDYRVDPPVNEALNAIDGHAWTTWYGPLVVMSKVPVEESDPKTYIDIVLTDFRDFIDYVFYYRELLGSASDGLSRENYWRKLHREDASGKVRVVRVACRDDQDKGMPEFSSLEIPKRHPAFRNADDPPSIAEVIDSRLCVPFTHKDLLPKDSLEQTAKLRNPAIEALYCDLGTGFDSLEYSHPDDEFYEPAEFGKTATYIMSGVGSVLLLDRNKRPLDVDYASALCKLCRTQIIPLAKRLHDSGMENEELHDEIRGLVSSSLPRRE